MKNENLFLRKVKNVILVVMSLLLLAGLGIGFGRQGFVGQVHNVGTKALAAAENEKQTVTEKRAVQHSEFDFKDVFQKTASGSLLQVTAYNIEASRTAEKKKGNAKISFENVSTGALALNAMQILEEGTLGLMASPAGSVWGGKIKAYAGETPLLITVEDKEVLLRIVEAEATSEDIKGRMLVANVILNRVVSKKFPNSITEVVFQNNGTTYQFAPIKDGRYWTVKVSDETREAVERVLAGEDYSQGALYFAARKLANQTAMRWFDTSLKYLFRHGVHEFFTDK